MPFKKVSRPVKEEPSIAGRAPVSFAAVNASIALSGISVKFAPLPAKEPVKLVPVKLVAVTLSLILIDLTFKSSLSKL